MLDLLILLGVLVCVGLLLIVLATLNEQQSNRTHPGAEQTLDALRTAQELRRDAWTTRQQMRRYAEGVIDLDSYEVDE